MLRATGVRLRAGGDHIHVRAVTRAGERDAAFDEREKRMIFSDPDALAGMEARPPLPHEDVPGDDPLAAEALHAEALRVRVAAVPGRARTLLRCE